QRRSQAAGGDEVVFAGALEPAMAEAADHQHGDEIGGDDSECHPCSPCPRGGGIGGACPAAPGGVPSGAPGAAPGGAPGGAPGTAGGHTKTTVNPSTADTAMQK